MAEDDFAGRQSILDTPDFASDIGNPELPYDTVRYDSTLRI